MNAEFFQVFSLIGALAIIAVSLIYWINRPRVRLILIPALSWAILAATYYTVVLTGILPTGEVARFFSAILRSVEVTLILGALIILIGRSQ